MFACGQSFDVLRCQYEVLVDEPQLCKLGKAPDDQFKAVGEFGSLGAGVVRALDLQPFQVREVLEHISQLRLELRPAEGSIR
ncbi:hypothetical protein D3C75_1118820 [compost metagenome]